MDFKQIIEKTFQEWKEYGYCKEAQSLNEKIGLNYFDTSNPQFFTGDINSELVLIHLNPKRNKTQWNEKCNYPDFKSYWQSYKKFGKLHYGKESKRIHRSQFDYKQILFLKPFNLISLDNQDKYLNLENVIDCKLQLELVPFGSPDFIYQKIGIENLEPFIKRILLIIKEKPRKYIIFCGRVFEYILKDFIIEKNTHSFKLKKKDGTLTKSDFQLINISIEIDGVILNACIAPQFAKQGYPFIEYGKKVKELYRM